MKKIGYGILLLVILPIIANAQDYATAEMGQTFLTGDVIHKINGVTGYLIFNYDHNYTNDTILPLYGYDTYDVRYYYLSKDTDGNDIYKLSNYFDGMYYTDQDNNLTVKKLFGLRNARWLLKDITGNLIGVYSNWYEDSGALIEDLDESQPANVYSMKYINFYQVEDGAIPTISCNKDNDKIGNTINCKINIQSDFTIYNLAFNLSSDKFNISNVSLTHNDVWSLTKEGNKYKLVYKNPSEKGSTYYGTNSVDSNDFTNGIDIASFDITYNDSIDVESITDNIVLSDYNYETLNGTFTDEDFTSSITFTDEKNVESNENVETVVENPKTGVSTIDYVLIPILLGMIILIKNRKKLTLFKNR